MNTTVTLSLPPEQLLLLEQMQQLLQKSIATQNGSAWLTESEAAHRLKVRECEIRTWRMEGWLRNHQVDEQVLYRPDELDEDFLAQAEVQEEARKMAHKANMLFATSQTFVQAAKSNGKQFKEESKQKRIDSGAMAAAKNKARSRVARSDIHV